jgi:hypothetical protein
MISRVPRFRTLPLFAVAAMLLAKGIAHAAAGDEALIKEAAAACQIASELQQSRVLWSSPGYEHQAALIVTGKLSETGDDETYMLCLFDKQTTQVELQEIEAELFR